MANTKWTQWSFCSHFVPYWLCLDFFFCLSDLFLYIMLSDFIFLLILCFIDFVFLLILWVSCTFSLFFILVYLIFVWLFVFNKEREKKRKRGEKAWNWLRRTGDSEMIWGGWTVIRILYKKYFQLKWKFPHKVLWTESNMLYAVVTKCLGKAT